MRGTQLNREVFSSVSLFCVYIHACPASQKKLKADFSQRRFRKKKVCGGAGGGLINHQARVARSMVSANQH